MPLERFVADQEVHVPGGPGKSVRPYGEAPDHHVANPNPFQRRGGGLHGPQHLGSDDAHQER
jgi:hypothetical protein